jgi:hypothetical protein
MGDRSTDPGFLNDGDLAGLQEGRKIASLPELWDFQVERAKTRVEGALAIAIAPVEPLGAAVACAANTLRAHNERLKKRLGACKAAIDDANG